MTDVSGIEPRQPSPSPVFGPGSSTDTAVARFDGTTGKLLQDSNLLLTDGGSLIFTPQTNPAYQRGQFFYDSVHECPAFRNDDSSVTLQIGQESWTRVRNETGGPIHNGSVVYINGNHPGTGLPTIALARANAAVTAESLGIVTETIPNNSVGYVTTLGEVHDLDTSAFSNGDILYLSAAVAGALTATPPASPNYVVRVAVVLKASAGNGVLFSMSRAPIDATLAALAAFNANGLLVQTAQDVFVARTITAGPGISVSNGGGALGDPVISVATLASATALGTTSGPTYSGASFALIPEMTATASISTGKALVTASASFNVQHLDSFDVALFADGTEVPGTRRHLEFNGGSLLGLVPGHIDGFPVSVSALVTGLSAGNHTLTWQWSRTAGTARAVGTQRRIDVMEIA